MIIILGFIVVALALFFYGWHRLRHYKPMVIASTKPIQYGDRTFRIEMLKSGRIRYVWSDH